MTLDFNKTRTHLKAFDFESLFYEELGWDKFSNNLQVSVNNEVFSLTALAEKRGMAAFLCNPSDSGAIPNYAMRRNIERQVAKSVHEHIIIYVDGDKTTQVWQWVRRETGRPTACREHTYHKNQPGDSLIQKLQSIAFSLEEEESLTLVDVAGRTRAAFDLDRVTKRFYDRFKKEHDTFLKFIDGIPDEGRLRWYTSVMLNRLMFVYFIQKKGFLDNNPDYLRQKLDESQGKGRDVFYRGLLCPLFFEGFARKEDERSPELSRLLGNVPYLNGGIFLKHQIEELYGEQIQIPDTAFQKLFDFFDQYQWHLDERPLRADNEINPDVLGYIFEKYVNQKQMGAYYTKEDITEYISKNTIIPFLFDEALKKCRIAFEGDQSVWKLLKADPDRYIYDAVRKGVELPLPEEIVVGLKEVAKRTEWNKPAPEEFALPTEIWREVVARRKRYEEIKAKALSGEIASINDFITYNLNIRQFANDVIETCEGPELLRAFYHAIEKVTVLDPTCGSGAFLFAALNILEPLYEACLDRMEVFLEELERSGEKHRSDKYGDFRKILARIDDHPNRRYFILKSIIINNLFGVDIMEEAVEICKLRLFLKLVAQIDQVQKIEPLPDIDFNIRAGNTLVGFARLEDVRQALSAQLFAGDALKRIEEKAEEADGLFELFRQMQTEQGMDSRDFSDAKQEVSKRLKVLEEELNGYLAESYGVDPKNKQDYENWLASHKPFHWFVEFYGILKHGGFDVIIGNPPYVEYTKIKGEYTVVGFKTETCGNLYVYVMERSFALLVPNNFFGMIVPISFTCSERMLPIRCTSSDYSNHIWVSNFAIRPQPLFAEIMQRNTIIICQINPREDCNIFSTNYLRWSAEERPHLFYKIQFTAVTPYLAKGGAIPKLTTINEKKILDNLYANTNKYIWASKFVYSELVYFHDSGESYWTKALLEEPEAYRNDVRVAPSQWFALKVPNQNKYFTFLFLNSNLCYWLWTVYTDCRHMTKGFIQSFPQPSNCEFSTEFIEMLQDAYKQNSRLFEKRPGYKSLEIKVQNFKPLIDEIDRVLAKHYGFTDEELDFIINYDIKYRMGLTSNGDEED